MQILAVDRGGFVSRGLVRHDSNLPNHSGVFGMKVSPVSSTMTLDDISPTDGELDDSSLLISEAYFANSQQTGQFDDCNGLALCSDLCADTGMDQGDPGPACPSPPDPCEHVSPCGDGHGPGEPTLFHQCNDQDDNDGDGLTDSADPQCNHTPSCQPGGDIPLHEHRFEAGADFGIFADVRWCTKQGDKWPSRLLDHGYFTETPFHSNTGWADYDNLFKWGDGFYSSYEKLVRLGIISCWLLDTEQEAEDCSNNVADCGAFASGVHKYPYRFGRYAPNFWRGLKIDVWHARGIGMDDPLNVAHTLTSALVGNSEAQDIPSFASVAGTNVSGPNGTPHEIGHSLSLTHCEVRKIGELWSLMGNVFEVNGCPPGEYGDNQLSKFSIASGDKLFECFTADDCVRDPNFGDPDPMF